MQYRGIFLTLIFSCLIVLYSSVGIVAQTGTSNVNEDAYKKMYEEFFGKAPSTEESVEIPVDLFVDLQPIDKVIILSDTFSKWYNLSKADFITFIIPLLKPDIQKKYKKDVAIFDTWIESDWLVERGFKLDYITLDQYLEIRIPPEIKGVQIINLSKKVNDFVKVEQETLKASLFSGYSNINYKRTYTDYEEAQDVQDETVTSSAEVVEFVNDVTFRNHLALGDIFLDNETSFLDSNWAIESLYVSKVFKASVFKLGFLDLNPLFGIQAENIEISRFLNQAKKFRSFDFETNEISYLTVKINRSTVYKQTVFPGAYRLTELPVKTGDNDIEIKVMTKTRNIVYKKEFYSYISSTHLPQYSMDYDIQYALYDRGNGNLFDRVQNSPFTLLNHSIGIGSLFNKYAMTLNTKWSIQKYQDWKQFSLLTGTKAGLFETAFAISNAINFSNGYFAMASFSPSKKLLEKWNQKKVLLSAAVQDNQYIDFRISPSAPASSAGGLISLNASFSLYANRPLTFSLEHYFTGEVNGKLISGYSKKGRFWELKTNVALVVTEKDISPLVFFTYTADFKKSGSVAELSYQPGSEPEVSYAMPYVIGNVPLDISLRPDKQTIGVSKTDGDQSLSLTYSTDNELTAKVDGSNNRASYGYIFKKNLTSDAASSYTSTSMHLTTAVMFSGKQVAISRPVNNNTFLIAASHDLLKQADVKIDEDLVIDYLGPAGLYYLKPSSKNTIKISPDSVPHNVIIERDNIEFNPEYGKGYHIEIGKEAPVILIGRIVNQNGDAESLVYGKILWDDGEKVFFTNQRGMFQTTLDVTGKTFSIELVDYPGMAYQFDVKEGMSGVVNLKSFTLK